MSIVDDISPAYLGEKRLVLAPLPGAPAPAAFAPVELTVDYSAADPDGVALPLELTVTAPSASGFERRFYRHSRPLTVLFVPREGGRHLVRLREPWHNRWWGSLEIVVAGERLLQAAG